MARFYVPNPGFSTEIMRERDFMDGLKRAAEGAARHAENFARGHGAPWMPRAGADNLIEVVEDGGNVYISNTDHGGHLLEFGSKNNPPHAPLRRGVQAAGLRFIDEGR